MNSGGHAPAARAHGASLVVALLIMATVTLYPRLLADAAGHADHHLATALFWAMSVGFVRGVGFVPRRPWLRALFSCWSCGAALAAAAALWWLGRHGAAGG
jgi:predicted membrane protein